MTKKNTYYIGEQTGYIGLNRNGFPVPTHVLVRVDSDETKIFQVCKKEGILIEDVWVEIPPVKTKVYDLEGHYTEITYECDGQEIPYAKLITQYIVTDITELALAMKALATADPDSPCINRVVLEIFEESATNVCDPAIIKAIEAAMK